MIPPVATLLISLSWTAGAANPYNCTNGQILLGSSTKSVSVSSLAECEPFCNEDSSCIGYKFKSSASKCWLMQTIARASSNAGFDSCMVLGGVAAIVPSPTPLPTPDAFEAGVRLHRHIPKLTHYHTPLVE